MDRQENHETSNYETGDEPPCPAGELDGYVEEEVKEPTPLDEAPCAVEVLDLDFQISASKLKKAKKKKGKSSIWEEPPPSEPECKEIGCDGWGSWKS